MAKITIEELSESLKEYLNGLGLTEAQVQELIDNMQEEVIGNKEELATNDKSSIVAAINELFQNANNGKELIANAIGEPVSSEDTFSAMSNDINGLLSTFKTNMMNNGVTVEAGDKFKALIDKIATLADNEGKGIQFAEGSIPINDRLQFQNVNTAFNFTFAEELNFNPTYIFVKIPSVQDFNEYLSTEGIHITSMVITQADIFNSYQTTAIGGDSLYVKSVDSKGFSIGSNATTDMYFGPYSYGNDYNLNYVAIGVGEEDTTLRDSLASILQEEGVSVTEEDDMASLISKVDEEFTNDNNTISNLNSQLNELDQGLSSVADKYGISSTGSNNIINDLQSVTSVIVQGTSNTLVDCNTKTTTVQGRGLTSSTVSFTIPSTLPSGLQVSYSMYIETILTGVESGTSTTADGYVYYNIYDSSNKEVFSSYISSVPFNNTTGSSRYYPRYRIAAKYIRPGYKIEYYLKTPNNTAADDYGWYIQSLSITYNIEDLE